MTDLLINQPSLNFQTGPISSGQVTGTGKMADPSQLSEPVELMMVHGTI
jgi:hypothetical protein